MAAFWRGEVTTRRLMVLISGLPEDSALHRALNDGHTWTTTHILMWHLTYLVERLESITAATGLQKRPKKVKKQSTPWDDDSVKRTGTVDEGDQADAVAFLMGMSSGEAQ